MFKLLFCLDILNSRQSLPTVSRLIIFLATSSKQKSRFNVTKISFISLLQTLTVPRCTFFTYSSTSNKKSVWNQIFFYMRFQKMTLKTDVVTLGFDGGWHGLVLNIIFVNFKILFLNCFVIPFWVLQFVSLTFMMDYIKSYDFCIEKVIAHIFNKFFVF